MNYNSAPGGTLPPEPKPMVKKTYLPYGFTEKTYGEKKAIRKESHALGISMLLLNLFSIIASILLILFSIRKSDNEWGFEIVSDPAVNMAFQIVVSIFLFTVPFIIIYKLFGHRISDLVPLSKSKKGYAKPILCFGIGFFAFSNIATTYIDNIFNAFGLDNSGAELELPQGVFGFLLTFLATAVAPALVEEFACRGLILGSLRKYGDGFAIIASSIVFGLMHGNFQQIPFAFLMGLILGFATVKTGSLRVSIAIHFFNNFISVIFSYAPKGVSDEIINIIYAFILLLALILGILFIKNDKNGDLFVLEPAKTECAEKKKYIWFFTSATMIIFTVYCLLESVLMLFT